MIKRLTIIILISSSLSKILVAQTNVLASVDVNRISQSETIGFKIVATNVDGTPNVDISPLNNIFKIISGPAQQTNIQWVNGVMTSSRSLSWTLLPIREGKLNIPSLTVKIGNNSYRTNPIGITVSKSAGRADMSNLFIEVTPDKRKLYLGEQLTVTYRLYTKLNLSIEDIEYPKSVGFWNEDLRGNQSPRFKDTQLNGVSYKVATLYKSAMFPTQTGEMIIAPMTAICNVEKASRNRPRGFADPFFNSMFRESQRQFIQSDSISIEVLPYPEKPPPDFTGAVGDFKINAWVDSNSAKVNEAVTFNIKIAGSGNIFNFNINPINFPQNMEIFPPISTINRDEFRDQITGELNFEYILIPRLEGQFRINPIALTYFDPNIDSFVTVRSNMTDIMVYPGENSESVLSKYSREDIKILAEDIRFIRTKTPSWYKSDSTTIPISIWGVYFVAFSMFLFPSLYHKVNHQRITTVQYREAKNALNKCLKMLKQEVDDPFSFTSSVIYQYFKSKLFLASINLDPMTLEYQLKGKIDNDLILKIVGLVKLCDAGRYGPEAAEYKGSIQSDTSELLLKIDSLLK